MKIIKINNCPVCDCNATDLIKLDKYPLTEVYQTFGKNEFFDQFLAVLRSQISCVFSQAVLIPIYPGVWIIPPPHTHTPFKWA